VFLLSRVRRMTYPQIARPLRHLGEDGREAHQPALAFCTKKVGGSLAAPS
jgi:hypothetical protein